MNLCGGRKILLVKGKSLVYYVEDEKSYLSKGNLLFIMKPKGVTEYGNNGFFAKTISAGG